MKKEGTERLRSVSAARRTSSEGPLLQREGRGPEARAGDGLTRPGSPRICPDCLSLSFPPHATRSRSFTRKSIVTLFRPHFWQSNERYFETPRIDGALERSFPETRVCYSIRTKPETPCRRGKRHPLPPPKDSTKIFRPRLSPVQPPAAHSLPLCSGGAARTQSASVGKASSCRPPPEPR